jgi:large repetitive protein
VTPTVAVSIDNTDVNIANRIGLVTFVFSASPAAFTLADASAVGGTLSNLQQVNATTYTATFTGGAGTDTANASVSVTAGPWQDGNGNSGAAGSTAPFTVDTVRPTVTVSIDNTDVNVAHPTALVTFIFSKPPTDFSLNDVTSTDGSLSNLSGSGTTYTATFTADAGVDDNTAAVSVINGSYHDADGIVGSGGSTISPVQFSNAVATFDETGWAPSQMIDGLLTGPPEPGFGNSGINGWSVFNYATGTSEAADALLTLASPLPAGKYELTFTIYQNYYGNPGHILGDFALDYTTATSPTLSGPQTPVSIQNASSLNGTTFSYPSPGELLANTSKNSIGTDTYTISALVDSASPITGIFLDAIKNPALPGGGPGGQYSNGNFVVSEFTLDAATGSSTTPFTVDTVTPPTPGAPSDSAVVNGYVDAAHDTDAQALTGNAEDGSTVTVYDNNAQVGTTSADASTGAWSLPIGVLADASTHSYTVTATDAAGNVSQPSAALNFTVDITAPATPAAPADSAVVNGYVNAAHDTAGQALTGSAEKGSTVTVYDNNTQVGTRSADVSTGAWSLPIGVLADGSTHSYTVTATDAAGNVSQPSAALNFSVDIMVPATPAAPSDSAVINGYVNAAHDTASQALTGSAEKGSTVTVYDSNTQVGITTADASTGAWSLPIGVLADGSTHSYTVTATDAAGNVSQPSAALNFTVDITAPATPAAPSDSAVVNSYVNAAHDTAAQALTGSAEKGSTVTLYDNNTQVGSTTADASTGAWSLPIGVLADGSTHSYTVTATDAAGNVSEPSAALNFTVDIAPPATPAAPADIMVVNGYVNAARDTPAQALTGNAEDGSTVTVYDNGTQIGTTTANASTGHWGFLIGRLADGSTHSYTITATDAVGNVSQQSTALSFTVDITPPAKPTTPADNAVVNGYVNAAHDTAAQALTGSAEDGSTVTVYDNGTKVGSTTASTSTGAWSYPIGQLADGSTHSYMVTATDVAGNVSQPSAALNFRVDITPPATPAAPADSAVVNGYIDAARDTAAQALTGSAEDGSTVTVYDNGTQIGTTIANASTGHWGFLIGQLTDAGTHSYTVTATDAAGNVSQPSAPLSFVVDTVMPPDAFLGNDTSDVLFRNAASGDIWFEAMSNGAPSAPNPWQQIGASDTHYSLLGVGDFYTIGTSDILFRNNSTGDTWTEAISNGAFGGWQQIGGSDTSYGVAGVGDFYGTGTSDILFRNDSTGDTWFEQMGTNDAWHQIGGSDTHYSVVGIGDFFGIGADDIVFRNNATGDTWLEEISNGAFVGWNQIGGSDTHYSVAGVGDFFGNGTNDILFRNNSTGDTWFEAVSNGAPAGWHEIGGSDTHYSVAGIGDYLGSNTSDILFRSASTGDTWFEAISSGAFASWNHIGGSSTSYSVPITIGPPALT